MGFKIYLIVVFVATVLRENGGSLIEIHKNCCSLGTNHSLSGLPCKDYKTPIPNVPASLEKNCLNTLDVCCKNQYRENQCNLGKNDAKNGKDCVSSKDTTLGDFKKDCCAACQLGIETGATGQSCEFAFGFGPPYDTAFTTCCEEFNLIKPTTPASTTIRTTLIPTVATTTSEPTTISSSSKTTTENTKKDPVPSIENICDFPDVCAQICIPTIDSYKCACNEGYTLMKDGISCKINQKSPAPVAPKSTDRCIDHNPCDQNCTDTGVAIQCSCYTGYELAKNKVSCIDIDECLLGTHECDVSETCVNEEGTYACESPDDGDYDYDDRCPPGYIFNADKKVCDDVDECSFPLICNKTEKCQNTVGSYKCVSDESIPKCPPGFFFKESIQDCQDIDECVNGQHDCNRESQTCLNTKGNFTCIDKTVQGGCPAGFKKNPTTLACEDINECVENKFVCNVDEVCINEAGGHLCVSIHSKNINRIPVQPKPKPLPAEISTTSTTSTTTTTTTTTTTPATPQVQKNPEIQRIPMPVRPPAPQNPPRGYKVPVSCHQGFMYSEREHSCVDINECTTNDHDCDSNQDCVNTHGSYYCSCKEGFEKDYPTGACVDINECQIGRHDCIEGQRCDNTIGSYLCSRTAGCGTGYTLNYNTGICQDDDECQLGTHTCGKAGTGYVCKNTVGSFRCERQYRPRPTLATYPNIRPAFPPTRPSAPSPRPIVIAPPTSTHFQPPLISQQKQCLYGYKKNAKGDCEDIDECEQRPCGRGQKCLNLNGSYQCISTIQCTRGMQLNEEGNACVDIDECATGRHTCSSTQICKNFEGYFTCECPPGHKTNRNGQCEDINECTLYRPCSSSAQCVNTAGSYECRCLDGMRRTGKNQCDDIDECVETPGLCQQKCVNVWGSYRCSCDKGYTLNADNRSCSDLDECEKFKDHLLCVHQCENTPGSYRCSCPKGYRLGTDGRTCQDVDECETMSCPHPDDICVNTRGDHKCHRISCPPNYVRDPEHKSRCKKDKHICNIMDQECLHQPQQYSYHFISLVSKFPIVHGHIDFFQMRGPTWAQAAANFKWNIVNVRCPQNIQKVDESYFRMNIAGSKAMLSIVKPIEGPHEIELQLEMSMYFRSMFTSRTVARIYLFVSQYTF